MAEYFKGQIVEFDGRSGREKSEVIHIRRRQSIGTSSVELKTTSGRFLGVHPLNDKNVTMITRKCDNCGKIQNVDDMKQKETKSRYGDFISFKCAPWC